MRGQRNNPVVVEGGAGVIGMLGVLFVGLKLAGVIGWSWLWVTAPFWGPFALAVCIFIIALVVWALMKALSKPKR